MKFQTISTITTIIGAGIILCDHPFIGFCFMIGVLPINMALSDDMDDYPTSSGGSGGSKKPYYKDEFEEYQHYKHVKRNMKK